MTAQEHTVDCEELRQMAEENPQAMAVVAEMLIEAEEELCKEVT